MNGEKSRNHLRAERPKPDSLEPVLQGARLDRDQYRRLLNWWVANGTQPKDTDAVKNWRERFIRALSADSYRWRELIQRDVKRLDERSKCKILDWLADAGGDPLMFLNLANVAPYHVLFQLDYWKAINDIVDCLRKEVRKPFRDDIKILKKAVRIVDLYQPVLNCYLDWRDYWKTLEAEGRKLANVKAIDTSGVIADANSIANVLSIIEVAEEIGLLSMGEKKRGGPSKTVLSYVVQHLIIMVRDGKTMGQPKKILYWGAITALLFAAFADWFKNTKNPVRNVKNAWNRRVHEKLLITHTQEGLLIWGPPDYFNPK
ncbi:MAG: hypothetical protein Q8S00_22215 [Deltaproteobacteria bacterium]|nr:hypothetical protein [Deltaproteobacteria bacterium]